MATFSIRRLSDATLAKYQRIIAEGGELTPRQKRALLAHADALDSQVAGLSGSLRAVKDELQMLISGAEKRGYRVTEVRNLKDVVFAIDEALKRNGATYD